MVRVANLDDIPGTLRWNDWPDPIGGREAGGKEGYDQLRGMAVKEHTRAADLMGVRPLNSRAALSIDHERSLNAALVANHYL